MKAYEIQQGAQSLDGLRQVERPDPSPQAGQILVRMHAASVNFRDQAIVTGRYFSGPVARNTIPLSDGAGEVVGMGPGVTRFKLGDRVSGTFFQGWAGGPPPGPLVALGSPADGVLAEYVVFNQNDAVSIPKSLSFEEGATLACAGVTAWHAISAVCRVKPGDSVLLLGSGGVSMFALQLARASGARVIVTSSSDEKIARAIALGADGGINYRQNRVSATIQELSGGGVDMAIDSVGEASWGESLRSLRRGGRLVTCGATTGSNPPADLQRVFIRQLEIYGSTGGNITEFRQLLDVFNRGLVRPVIDSSFAMADVRSALARLASGAQFGKVSLVA